MLLRKSGMLYLWISTTQPSVCSFKRYLKTFFLLLPFNFFNLWFALYHQWLSAPPILPTDRHCARYIFCIILYYCIVTNMTGVFDRTNKCRCMVNVVIPCMSTTVIRMESSSSYHSCSSATAARSWRFSSNLVDVWCSQFMACRHYIPTIIVVSVSFVLACN